MRGKKETKEKQNCNKRGKVEKGMIRTGNNRVYKGQHKS